MYLNLRVMCIIKTLQNEYDELCGVGYGWSGTYPTKCLYIHFRLEGVNQVTDREGVTLYWQTTVSPQTHYTVPTRDILVKM